MKNLELNSFVNKVVIKSDRKLGTSFSLISKAIEDPFGIYINPHDKSIRGLSRSSYKLYCKINAINETTGWQLCIHMGITM